MSQMLSREVASIFAEETGLRLATVARTSYIRIVADPSDYLNELHGPYEDPGNPDVRLFLNYRRLGLHWSIDLLVQDTDDDVFLNSHALGAEKYHNLRASGANGDPHIGRL